MKADRVIADQVLQDIADYVIDYKVESEEALNTARNCLIDTIGCGLNGFKISKLYKAFGPFSSWHNGRKWCKGFWQVGCA
jgi:2-methylcitrate dehydratase PrpD